VWEKKVSASVDLIFIQNETVPNSGYQYKFQGQENQDELGLNWDSFKWRNYMPDLGRFFNVDPLSEDYSYQSHYNFAENKVIDHIELEGLEGLHHTVVNSGVTSHVIEKNVIFLRQTPQLIPEGATQKEINKINKNNINTANSEYDRINLVKQELSDFYGGSYQNSQGETVTFKINYSEILTENTDGNGIIKNGQNLRQVSITNGLTSSECDMNNNNKIVGAAIFTSDTDTKGGLGLTRGGMKISVNSSTAPNGTYAHEFIHTLAVPDNGYTKGGVLNSPPQSLIKSEIDEILKISFKAY
jgi:RHS repeat-associated protein